jgi:DNA (cytosine-5)-methyltransferase 1
MGYHRAGFDEIVGVDIKPQPRYPFRFELADAMTYPLDGFDAIHASPPCQFATTASNGWQSRLGPASERHIDLLTPTRERLIASGVPWVIENVPGAPMRDYMQLCGLSFGLKVKRHRWFESSVAFLVPPCGDHTQDFVICFGGGVRGRTHQIGRTTKGKGGPILRRPTLTLEVGRSAMGINWMDRHELSQAIPPAYTEYIGKTLLKAMIPTGTGLPEQSPCPLKSWEKGDAYEVAAQPRHCSGSGIGGSGTLLRRLTIRESMNGHRFPSAEVTRGRHP